MTDYAATLAHLHPGSEWILTGDGYEGLTWLSDTPKPTKKTLDAAWPQVELDVAWDEIRSQRDALLKASDWTQVADAPVDAAAWAVYRQALRDVPQDFASPDQVVWPVPPS